MWKLRQKKKRRDKIKINKYGEQTGGCREEVDGGWEK